MLKNISTLGKTLSREAQQNIFGGSTRSPHCPDQCSSGTCSDPNHSCTIELCGGDGGSIAVMRYVCACTTGIGIQ